ncbi:hypothetical protein Taro_055489 [Colocasia esculenta]|uniref:Uncharacterized protein n=1 Tax=Colocasia esculenta TaxID=4460 RepID=A0A843XUE8_COLES|nr:hypothetical protein [Colocasia esculenta]
MWRRVLSAAVRASVVSSNPWVVTQTSGSLAGVREVCGFPARFVCVLQVGCSCCCVTCVVSVVARCVRAVVAQLAVESLAVVFTMWRTVAGKSRCGAPGRLRRIGCVCAVVAERACVWCSLHRCRVVVCGTGRSVFALLVVPYCWGVCCVGCVCGLLSVLYYALCSAWSSLLLGLSRCSMCRVALLVECCDTCLWLLSAWCWLVVSSGSSQDRPLSLLVEVLPRSALCSFRTTVVLPLWFEVCCLVGLHSGEVLPERLLVLLVEVLPKAALCLF